MVGAATLPWYVLTADHKHVTQALTASDQAVATGNSGATDTTLEE